MCSFLFFPFNFRSDCVATCCLQHVQKTVEWKDKLTEETIRERMGEDEDVDDVYTNIATKQQHGIDLQRGVKLVTEVNRLSIPLSQFTWTKGTCFEHHKEPDWYLSYISLVRFRYSVELDYSLKDTEKNVYDTITVKVMTEAETKEYIHQLVTDLDKWEEEENGGKNPRANKKYIVKLAKSAKNLNVSYHATVTSKSGNNSGQWTYEEHNLFLQGVELHGKCNSLSVSTKIAATIKSRTPVQVRTHALAIDRKLAKSAKKLAKSAKNLNATVDVIMTEADKTPEARNTSFDTAQTSLNSSLDTTDENEKDWNDAPLPTGSVNGYIWKVGHN